MVIPMDGRTLTLYQSKQRGRLYWYVCWMDDQGKVRHHYLGKTLPDALMQPLLRAQMAQDQLQAAIRSYFRIHATGGRAACVTPVSASS